MVLLSLSKFPHKVFTPRLCIHKELLIISEFTFTGVKDKSLKYLKWINMTTQISNSQEH